MSHLYHDGLPGYHADQVLHDGCPECEERGADPAVGIAHLDASNFERAWLRAADLRASTPPSGHRAMHLSSAEPPLLDALWIFQVRLEQYGWPLGVVPYGALAEGRR